MEAKVSVGTSCYVREKWRSRFGLMFVFCSSVIDTRAAPVDDCLDIPWEYVDYENEFYVSCGDFEFVNSTDCGGDFAKEFPSANPDVNG